ETEKTISLNSVNTEKNTEDVVTATTATLSGGALTVTTNVKSNEEDVNNTYNGTSWETNTTTTATESESVHKQTYSVVVSIYKDNTYTQTVTEGASSVKSTTTFTSGGTSVVSGGEVTEGEGTTATEVTEGTWSWADAKKDKIIIDAGEFAGTLLRLAKDEAIITEDGNESDVDVDVTVYDGSGDKLEFATQNDNNDQYKDAEGTETSDYASTSVYSSKGTWEKTDKESDREDAGEAAE
ncbi:MAG: hypothetical protein ACJAZ2_000896, partial [Glaciecola sp.]